MGGFGSPSGKNRSLEPERITRPPSRPLPDREIPAVRLYGVGKFWPKSFYNLDYKREDRAVAEHDFVALRKRTDVAGERVVEADHGLVLSGSGFS